MFTADSAVAWMNTVMYRNIIYDLPYFPKQYYEHPHCKTSLKSGHQSGHNVVSGPFPRKHSSA